jgi:AcrR family transcriptional regulator
MSASTPSTSRGPYAKTRGRVDAIRAVTYDLVVEAGHRTVTIAEIARRSGLTEAQVLYHFPSREHLLVGALEHADRRTASGSPTADGDLEAGLAAAASPERADPEVLRLFVAMCAAATDPEHPAHAWGADRTRAIVQRYAELLGELQAAGRADPDVEPRGFARRFMALWDGLQAQWLVDPSFDLGREVALGFRQLAGAAGAPERPGVRPSP